MIKTACFERHYIVGSHLIKTRHWRVKIANREASVIGIFNSVLVDVAR